MNRPLLSGMDGHFPKRLYNVGVSSECRVLWFVGTDMGAKSVNIGQNVLGADKTAEIALRGLLTSVVAKVIYPAILQFSHDQLTACAMQGLDRLRRERRGRRTPLDRGGSGKPTRLRIDRRVSQWRGSARAKV